LKFWNKARWRNTTPSLKELHDEYSNVWDTTLKAEPVDWQDDNPEEQKATGWKLLDTYLRESPIAPDEKPEAVEVAVEADLAKHGLPNLVGVIDLVRPPGIIVDFKTSGRTPDVEMSLHTTEVQTTGYGVLYREATGKKESGIQIHTLVKTKAPKLIVSTQPPATDGQVKRLYRIIDSYVAGLSRGEFIPAPGMQCLSCEFFNELSAGTQSAPPAGTSKCTTFRTLNAALSDRSLGTIGWGHVQRPESERASHH
jgi:putative RecB family exonuclease